MGDRLSEIVSTGGREARGPKGGGGPESALSERCGDELIDESQKMAVGERYPEALEYALFAVEQEDNPEDPYNPALIGPVMNLADIQEKLQLDREAAESIERAIDLIERDGGIYDARLVEAINDAGRLLQKNGEHEKAIDLFHRSQHISHRVDGVYSPDQVSALELMTRSYLSMGNLDKANSAQNFRYMVDLHQFGRGSILSVPSMVKLARFKSDLRLYDNARQLYKSKVFRCLRAQHARTQSLEKVHAINTHGDQRRTESPFG